MATKNSITGDEIKSKSLSKEGRENYDNIFRKKMNKKIILATASWCGPCKTIKDVIEKENLSVEIKSMDDDTEFFKTQGIKSVPQLLVFQESSIDFIKGFDDILKSIRENQ
jgi:thiol-disulfide isomerase/thioredoxin